MVLKGKGCATNTTQDSGLCISCKVLTENRNLQGVLQWIETGIYENTPLTYHSVGGLVTLARRKTGQLRALQMRRLDDVWKLAGKAVALDDMKWWVMAVGSGKVECIDCLVRINLARSSSIQSLLNLYDWAAKRVYHPQNYTEEDQLQGLLLWRLSGSRVAGIAHQALNFPSVSILHHHMLIPRLLVFVLVPTKLEIKTNVTNNFEDMYELLESHWVIQQVFMLDELKTEEWLHFNDATNKIVGICCEHGKKTSLEFTSEKEVGLLLDCIDKGEVHLAVEVSHESSRFMSDFSWLDHCRSLLAHLACWVVRRVYTVQFRP